MRGPLSTTNPKLLRWAFEGGLPPPSPSTSDPGEWGGSASSLAFLSSQLVAHGFARPPGLVQPLHKLGPDELEPVVKCLRDLLEQRITDMERIEELSARLRCLSQDHERLIGLHKTANEQVAQAQRDCELAKSKHAITTLTLVELQSTHKQVLFNLQRAQSALQFARQTAQNEIKRKDKEIERIQERWAKVVNDQPKSALAVGMRCANLAAESTSVVSKGSSLLETSLVQMKTDHERLSSQNESFRNILIALASGLDKIARRGASHQTSNARPITDLTIFPPTKQPWKDDAENARRALQELLQAAETAMQNVEPQSRACDTAPDDFATNGDRAMKARLEVEIVSLRAELEKTREALTEQMNGALDAFTRDQRLLRGQPRESAVNESESASADNEHAKTQLEERERLLEEGKEKLAAAAVELGKERNALADSKLELQEERRAWKLQQMLDELPETPPRPRAPLSYAPAAVVPLPSRASDISPKRQKARSPKKAALRLSPTKKSPRKMLAHTARPLLTEDVQDGDGAFPNPLSLPASMSANPFDQILAQSAQAAQSLNALTLSPEKKPPAPAVAPSLAAISAPVFTQLPPVAIRSESITKTDASSIPSVPASTSSNPPSFSGSPATPTSLSAAQARLKKNPYAPAVPSPLSRILRIADSPPPPFSPENGDSGSSNDRIPAPRWTLAKLVEDDEGEGDGHLIPVPVVTLADELGIDSDEHMQRRSPTRRINRSPSPRRRTAKERNKSKFLGTQPHASPISLLRAREKENAIPIDRMGTTLTVPPREDGLKPAKLGASRISIGAKVVGGRPTTNPPSLANRGRISVRTLNTTTGGPRSLRDRVGARYGQMTTVPRAD